MRKLRQYFKIPFRLVSIDGDGFHIMFSAKVNRKKANLLIDTGASKTVFDLERVKRFMRDDNEELKVHSKLSTGLGTNSLESRITLINLKFEKIYLKDFVVVVVDMSHINEAYQSIKLPPIDGVIGSDVLALLDAQINYRTKILKLFLPADD